MYDPEIVHATWNTDNYFDPFLRRYRTFLDHEGVSDPAWPVISGFDMTHGCTENIVVLIFRHKFNALMRSAEPIHPVLEKVIGPSLLTNDNREALRRKVSQAFDCKPKDTIVLFRVGAKLEHECAIEIPKVYRRHQVVMGTRGIKVFLSHKGADKPLVRQYRDTLKVLGFQPWLDEEAMPAGTELERGLLRAMQESCAVVFFVTPSFTDEKYLATEVDYAIAEKRTRPDEFAIITLVFADSAGKRGDVPDLLRRYVYKEPATELEALRYILEALPIVSGPPQWRS